MALQQRPLLVPDKNKQKFDENWACDFRRVKKPVLLMEEIVHQLRPEESPKFVDKVLLHLLHSIELTYPLLPRHF